MITVLRDDVYAYIVCLFLAICVVLNEYINNLFFWLMIIFYVMFVGYNIIIAVKAKNYEDLKELLKIFVGGPLLIVLMLAFLLVMFGIAFSMQGLFESFFNNVFTF